MSLPWKNESNDLSSNYDVAKRRFDHVPLYDQYRKVIQDIVEDVKNVETDNSLYYLPHRAVINEECLPTKLRVVFDASSHATGCSSLNEALI